MRSSSRGLCAVLKPKSVLTCPRHSPRAPVKMHFTHGQHGTGLRSICHHRTHAPAPYQKISVSTSVAQVWSEQYLSIDPVAPARCSAAPFEHVQKPTQSGRVVQLFRHARAPGGVATCARARHPPHAAAPPRRCCRPRARCRPLRSGATPSATSARCATATRWSTC